MTKLSELPFVELSARVAPVEDGDYCRAISALWFSEYLILAHLILLVIVRDIRSVVSSALGYGLPEVIVSQMAMHVLVARLGTHVGRARAARLAWVRSEAKMLNVPSRADVRTLSRLGLLHSGVLL